MAIVTLTITDEEDNLLRVSLESDPPFPGPAAVDKNYTKAQTIGLELLKSVVDPRTEVSEPGDQP